MSIGDKIKAAQEESRRFDNVKLGIGVPHNFHSVPMAFFDSFITMETPPFVYIRSSAGQIEDMRNGLVREALAAGCTHLIMMDTDQVYHPRTIRKLLSHKLPIVGCLVYRRYPPFDPLMFKGTQSKYLNINTWREGELVKVDATGTGCLLFDMKVFKILPEPWFKHILPGDGIEEEGEDFYFCRNAREAGLEIYVDTSIPCGHLSQMIVNEGTYKLYSRMKEAELKAMHKVEHGAVVAVE